MEQFWALCRSEGLLPEPGEKILVAVSGGADSMCLLALLLEAGERCGFSVEVAHFDHQIRPTSGADGDFVRKWCEGKAVPFHLGRGDVPSVARDTGTGLEDAARQCRYAFLQKTAHAIGAGRVATAHHAEDNAETVLLHLLRGSGLKGLGGIAPKQGLLVRPLLTTARQEIEAYNEAHHIPHVEDATNADTTYTRNFLRHEVLPLLTQRNPSVVEALNRAASALRQDNDYLEAQAEALLASVTPYGGGYALPAELLRTAHPALGNRALQKLVERLDSTVVLTADQRTQGLALCEEGRSTGWVSLPHGLTLGRVYDHMVVYRAEAEFRPVALNAPGTTETPGWRFTVTEAVCPEGKFNQPECFYLKRGSYLLRPRKTGDSITLPARPRKTVKKLLSDSRVPRPLRDAVPVFTAGEQVAALAGFGADRAFLPQPGERCYRITVTRWTENN